jgi:hypothetical protein
MAYGMSHSNEILSNAKECQYVAFYRQEIFFGRGSARAETLCPTRALSYK